MGLDEQQSLTTTDHDAAINNNMAASLCADHHLTLLSKRKRPIAADDHSSSTNRKRHKHLSKRRKKQQQSVVSSSIIAVNSNRVETPPTSDASEPPSPFVDDINVQTIKDDDCFGNTRRPLSAPPSSTSQISVYSRPPISIINNHASVDIPAPTSMSESRQRRVTFDGVTVYYFERSQGFSCVPSFGGITLGMCERHHCTERFSITEHERRNTIMNRQRSNATKTTSSNGFIDRKQQQSTVDNLSSSVVNDDTKVSINSSTIVADDQISMKDTMTENVEVDNDDSTAVSDDDDDDGHSEEDEVDEDTFLQPLRGRDRRQLLRSAGVRVDRTERNECQSIRQSRQTCGCTCVGECRPDSCECALNDIKCQVDRPSFPCACSVESCANPRGRVEFNVLRVRTHYMQTMMRMRMIEQQQTLGRLIMSSQSPTHIRFEDDGSTYCMQPPPMIYHQQHSAIDSLMQRIPRLSSSSSTSTTGSDSVFASSTSSPLASPGCLVASHPSSTICYPTKPVSLTYPSSLSTTNTTTTTNGHYSLSLNNFSSTFNNNNHYPSSNYQRNVTAIGTNESRYNGTVLDQLSDEDDDEQIDEEATISDEEVFVGMNDKCQANGDHHHRRASIGIGGSMMVESPPVIIVNNDGSLPQSSNNTPSHCGSSSSSTNIIMNGGGSFEQRRSHHESVYVD